MPRIQTLLLCLFAVAVVGCNTTLPDAPSLPKLKVYKIDVAQGNIIDANQLAQLAVGMPKRHVKVLLGTPLLQDPFHPERWDYIYNLQPGGEARQQRRVSLFFDAQDQLQRLEGDVVGQLRQTPLQITRAKTTVSVPALAKTEETGFWRGIRKRLPFSGDESPNKPVQTLAVPTAPTIATAVVEEEKVGFWGGLKRRLPFVGGEKDNQSPTPEAIATTVTKVDHPTPQTTALTSPAIHGESLPVPGAATTAQPQPTRGGKIYPATPALTAGMSLSEVSGGDDVTQTGAESPQELDDKSGLFDGLLRKIGG